MPQRSGTVPEMDFLDSRLRAYSRNNLRFSIAVLL